MADTAGFDAYHNASPTVTDETIYPGELNGLGASDPDKFPIDGAAASELVWVQAPRWSYWPANTQVIRESTTPAVNVVRQNPLLIRSNP